MGKGPKKPHSPVSGPCVIEDENGDPCPNEAKRMSNHGPICDSHRRRLTPKRSGGLPLRAPIQAWQDPREKLREAAIAMADADSEDDDGWKAADMKLAKVAITYASGVVKSLFEGPSEAERRNEYRARALAAMERGVQYGPAPKINRDAAAHAINAAGGKVREAARALGVTHWSLMRAMKRTGADSENSHHWRLHSLSPNTHPPTASGGATGPSAAGADREKLADASGTGVTSMPVAGGEVPSTEEPNE